MADDDGTQTVVAFHAGRLQDAFNKYVAEHEVDREAVEINQFDHETGSQWWARSKGKDGEYGGLSLLYEMDFSNAMEAN